MGVEQRKKKKKGRPSLLDLQKRHIKEQQQELQHYQKSKSTPSFPSNPNSRTPNSNPSGRRSTRRNPIIDPSDSDESNSDDEDSAPNRRQKKQQQLNRVKPDSDSDEEDETERSAKKRKINAIADGSGIKGEKLASGSANSNGLQGISVDDGNGTVLPDKKLLAFVLDRLQKKDTYGVYSEPVDPDELPDYHEVIKHPMDFSTVRRKLDEGAYANLEQFESDIFLISSNAMQYNAPDTVYFRQAKSIQELAERSFDNLRRYSDDEEQKPKVARRGRPPTKHLKRPVGRLQFDRAGSELTSGANLATGGESTMWSNYDLRKGSPADKSGPFDSVGRSHFVPGNSEANSSGLFNQQKMDRNDDYTGSQLRGGSYKLGKKTVAAIDHRRDTYKQYHPSTADNSSSVFKTFDEEKKLLLPVGLHAEYGYARSLARFSAGLGPVAWSIASKNIEKSLPPDVKFGPGWVGHDDVKTQRPVLINPSSSGQPAASDAFSPPSVTAHSVLKLHGDKPAYQQEGGNLVSNQLASTSTATDSQPGTTSVSVQASSIRSLENPIPKSAELNRLSPEVPTHLQQSNISTTVPRPPLKPQQDPIVYLGTGSLGMKYYQPRIQLNMPPQTSQPIFPFQMNHCHQQVQMQSNQVNPQPQMNPVNPQPQMNQANPQPLVNQANPQPQMNQANPQPQMKQGNPRPQMHQANPQLQMDHFNLQRQMSQLQMNQRNVQSQLNHYAGPSMQLATGFNPNYLQMTNLVSRANTDVAHSVAGSSSTSQSTNFFLTNENKTTNHSSNIPTSEAMAASDRTGHHPEPTSHLFGQQQRQESVPPDLNIQFQSPGSPSSSSRMDSKQPDLALQL